MANVVGERYQITIDKHVRQALGVKPGDLAVERVENGRLVVDFIAKPQRESLYGIFRRPGVEPIQDWSRLREDAWTWRQREIEARDRGELINEDE